MPGRVQESLQAIVRNDEGRRVNERVALYPISLPNRSIEEYFHGMVQVMREPEDRHGTRCHAQMPFQPLRRSETELLRSNHIGERLEIDLLLMFHHDEEMPRTLAIPQEEIFRGTPRHRRRDLLRLLAGENGGVVEPLAGNAVRVEVCADIEHGDSIQTERSLTTKTPPKYPGELGI